MAIIFAIGGFSQGEITIGSGTSTTSYVPMYCNNSFSYTQTIYTSTELPGGTIYQIAYYMTSTSSRTENIVIYAGNTIKTSFASASDYEALTNLTEVFNDTITFNEGWNYITFTTPFLYNGVDNLIIAVDKNTGTSSSRSWQSHTASFTSCLYYYTNADNILPSSPIATSKSTGSARPNTKFVITPTDPNFCYSPENLTSSNIGHNFATIKWSFINNVSSYKIEYKTTSQTWTDATIVSGITDTTYTFSNLNSDTQYDVRVSPECTSFLSSLISFKTACTYITQFPWNEGFDNAWTTTAVNPGNEKAPSTCWLNVNANSSSYLWKKPSTSTIPAYVRTGTGSAQLYGLNNAMSDYLLTPVFTLTGNQMLKFYGKGYSTSTNYPEHLWIKLYDVTTNGDFSSLADTANFITIGFIDDTNQYTWNSYEYVLNNYVGDYRIVFGRNDNVGYYYQLDDVSIDATPTCPNTYNLASTGNTNSSISLNWSTTNSNGSGWQIVYGDAATFDTLTSNIINVPAGTTLPYEVTGLNSSTLYKFAVRQNCGGNFSNIISNNTIGLPVQIPVSIDFENPTELNAWSFNNGNAVNKWFIGSAVSDSIIIGNSLYISKNNGDSNVYNTSTQQASSVSRLIEFNGSGEYELSFDVRVGGESTYDYIKVYITDPDTIYEGIFNSTPYWANNTYDINQVITNYDGTKPYFNGYNGSSVVTYLNRKTANIPYQGPAGTIKKLTFVWRSDVSGGTQPPAAIDNISIIPVLCSTPDSLIADNITGTSMDVQWVERGNATEWLIDYRHIDSTAWNTISVFNNPYTLSNLEPRNVYQLRVRGICNSTDTTNYTPIVNYGTSCEAISEFPWSFGFEGVWFQASGISNESKPFCWINFNGGTTSSKWRKTTTSSYINTGSAAAQAYSGSTTNSTPLNDWLITPQVTLSGNQFLRFWAKGYESSTKTYIDSLEVVAFDITSLGRDVELGDTLSNYSIIMPRTQMSPNTYTEYEIDLRQLSGDYRIGFVVSSDSGGYFLNLDDILINDYPSCSRPSDLTYDTLTMTENSVTLSWITEDVSNNSWILYYKPSSSSVWDSIPFTGAPIYTLTGLNHSTSYNWYVRTDCGYVMSENSIEGQFTTQCGIISQFPWSYGFEDDWVPALNPGNQESPYCWTVVDKGWIEGSYQYWWKRNTTASNAHSGTSSAQVYTDYGDYDHNDWLITPQISLNGSQKLSFWARRYSASTSEPDEISVYISDENITLDTTGMGQFGNMPNFTRIFNQLLPVGDWQEYTLNLREYTGNRYIAFVRQGTPDGYYLRLDDVLIDNLPTCMYPSNLTLSNLQPTQVDIGFFAGNETDNNWKAYYKTSGATEYDSVVVTSNPFTLTNLLSDTSYSVYFRTDCGIEGLSEASNIINFRTPCNFISIPFIESFDSLTASSSAIIPCWTRSNTQSTSSNYPYPSSTYSSSPSKSLYFYAGNGKYNLVVSPLIDVTTNPINTLKVKFKQRISSSSYKGVQVGVMTDPNDYSNFVPIGTTMPNSQTSTFENKEVSLANYVGNGSLIALRLVGEGATNGAYIDDFEIATLTACEKPQFITESNITSNSADISWNNGNLSDNSWWIYYKESSNTDYDSILISSNPYTLQGLAPATTYNIYIRTDCGSTAYSESSEISTFITECVSLTQLPYFENFDTYGTGTSAYPTCWSRINTSSTTYPYINTTNSSAPGSLYFSATSSGVYNIAITPEIDASIPINTLMTRFNMRKTNTNSKIIVGVMETLDVNSFTPIDTVTSIIPSAWEMMEVNFSTYTGNGKYIAFKSEYDTASNTVYIDDVIIDRASICDYPDSLMLIDITSTDAQITFNPANTTDNQWRVYYRVLGDNTWIQEDILTIPHTILGLSVNSNYELFVKTLCNDATYSSASDILYFSTLCSPISQLPYSESFDSYGTGSSAYPTCWSRIKPTTSTNPYINSTNSSSPGSLYFNSTSGDVNIAMTPQFDASIPINTLMASFKIRKSNATSKIIVGVMSNPLDETTFDSVTTISPSTTSTWEDFEVNFMNYNGNGDIIAFKSIFDTITNTVYIDDLVIDLIPSCTRPNRPVASNATSSSIDISWVDPNTNNTSWYIYIRPVGNTDWDSIPVNSSPVTLSNLTDATTYQIMMATDCYGLVSNYTNIITYATTCIPFSTLPWNEGFENITAASEFPSCFATQGVSGKLTSAITTLDHNRSARTDSNYAYFVWSCWNRLYTPTFDLVAGGNYTFSFWYKADGGSGWGELSAGLYTSQGDTSSFVSTIGTPITSGVTNTTYQQYTGSFTISTSGTYSIGIFANANSTPWYLCIDDLYLDGVIPCSDPTLITSVPSQTSATISWTAGGSESQWEVRLGESGTVQTTGTNSNFLLSGLTPDSSYTVYIRANCGGTYSNWISHTFTTLSGPYSPEVTTLLAESVSFTSVTLNGSYLLGSDTITSIGFDYRPVGTTTWTSDTVGNIATPFLKAITGLTSNTQYEFKAFVISTSFNKTSGDIVTFTTLQIVPPTVTTLTPNPISYTTATFLGTIVQGSESIIARGFEYKLPSQTWQDGTPISATGTNNISASVTSLQQGTTYEVRAYARTASTTTYGTTITFTTLTQGVTPPTVNTLVADQIGDRSAILLGTVLVGNEAITDQGFEWKVASASTWTPVTVVPVNDTLNYQLTGIEPTTNYEFKAYATTATTTTYGTTQTFMTLGINEIDGSLITVMMYPNPTSEETKLVVTGLQGDVKIIVSDVQGRIINTINSRANNNKVEVTLNVSGMAKGVYYVRLQNEQVRKTQKLIVK